MNTNIPSSPKPSQFPITLIFVFLGIGFVLTFFSGYYLHVLLSQEQPGKIPRVYSSPGPSDNHVSTSSGGFVQPGSEFLPDKHYFEDTIIVVARDAPHTSFIGTITRGETDKNYKQSTRVSYFDGKNWNRKFHEGTNNSASIVSNEYITRWTLTVDPSRVLRERLTGDAAIEGDTITFDSGPLTNEIGMRSIPGYTKFMSKGSGSLTIDGVKHEANVLRTKIYSLNASDIQFYSGPLGVTTDWVAFWTDSGEFYHIDRTQVTKPTPIYQSHQIGVKELADGSVIKTFSVDPKRDSDTNPKSLTFGFKEPIQDNLKLSIINRFDKYPWLSNYVWFMGQVEGSVQKPDGSQVSGFGLAEYIHE